MPSVTVTNLKLEVNRIPRTEQVQGVSMRFLMNMMNFMRKRPHVCDSRKQMRCGTPCLWVRGQLSNLCNKEVSN